MPEIPPPHDWSWNDGLCPVCNRPPGNHQLINNRCAGAPWPPESIERWRATHPAPARGDALGRFYPQLAYADETHVHTDVELRAGTRPGIGMRADDVFRCGSPKTPEAAAAAFDALHSGSSPAASTHSAEAFTNAIRDTNQRLDAEHAAREAVAREWLTQQVGIEIGAALQSMYRHPDPDRTKAATDAAVEVFVEFLRNPPVREHHPDGTETVRWP